MAADPLTHGAVAEAFADSLRTLAPARLLVAFSGGLDSTALLVLARRHAAAAQVAIRALHFNHAVHPDAVQWEQHCRDVCQRLGVPIEVGHRDATFPGDPSEGVLREARYAYFSSRMQPEDVLLTGHHRGDLAETLMLNLMRGAGLHGMAAVPARRALGAGTVLRPLLAVSRADLLPVARQAELHWIDDPGNLDLSPRRNFIRQRIIPLLSERWPGAVATLARAADLAGEAATLLDESLARDLAQARTADPAVLALDRLQHFSAARQRAILRLWLRGLAIGSPSRARLTELVRQLAEARPDAQPLAAFGGCQVRRYRQLIYALRPPPPIDPAACLTWETRSLRLPAGAGALEWRREGPDQPCQDALPRLLVRFATADKTLKPAGRRHRRPLRLLYQEAGLPPWQRRHCPLIYRGDRLIGVGDLYWTDEFERMQQRLGARYCWLRPAPLDPEGPSG